MAMKLDILGMVLLIALAIIFVFIFIWLLKVLFATLTKCWEDASSCPFIYILNRVGVK
jgi:flagellar biogenesis protein FliO